LANLKATQIQYPLQFVQIYLVGRFGPLLTFYNVLRSVQVVSETPNFSEMKGGV
jgi:hypothetical protein